MAKWVNTGKGTWCVAHSVTGQVLKRKGKRVCFTGRGAKDKARREANATRCKVKGGNSCPVGPFAKRGKR